MIRTIGALVKDQIPHGLHHGNTRGKKTCKKTTICYTNHQSNVAFPPLHELPPEHADPISVGPTLTPAISMPSPPPRDASSAVAFLTIHLLVPIAASKLFESGRSTSRSSPSCFTSNGMMENSSSFRHLPSVRRKFRLCRGPKEFWVSED